MEVASPPIPFAAPGTKRSLPFSSSPTNHGKFSCAEESSGEIGDENNRSSKRRRFHSQDTSIDSLSNAFSSHSPFFSGPSAIGSNNAAALNFFKRSRSNTASPVQKDLHAVIEEQAATIDSLKKDKSTLESSLASTKSDNDRLAKENQVLRKAVSIQQDRQKAAESEIKSTQQQRTEADEQIRKLEQVIMTLRYHLQAQQTSNNDNFLGFPPRPPDIF